MANKCVCLGNGAFENWKMCRFKQCKRVDNVQWICPSSSQCQEFSRLFMHIQAYLYAFALQQGNVVHEIYNIVTYSFDDTVWDNFLLVIIDLFHFCQSLKFLLYRIPLLNQSPINGYAVTNNVTTISFYLGLCPIYFYLQNNFLKSGFLF